MRLPRKSIQPSTRTPQGVSRLTLVSCRLLLGLTCILLAIMPITEHLWTFDRFLRGGPDLELGLLAILAIFALVAVLSSQRRQCLATMLEIKRLLDRHVHLISRPLFSSNRDQSAGLEDLSWSCLPSNNMLPLLI